MEKKTGTNNAVITPFADRLYPGEDRLLDYWHIHTSGTIYGTNALGEPIELMLKLEFLPMIKTL